MGDKLNDLKVTEAYWTGTRWNPRELSTEHVFPWAELVKSDEICTACRISYDKIKDVIFNNPATIILWKDGTKTVVKVKDGEIYEEEKGLAMAICKKVLGGDYHKVFNAYTPDDCGSITDWYDLGYDMGYRLGSISKYLGGIKDGLCKGKTESESKTDTQYYIGGDEE